MTKLHNLQRFLKYIFHYKPLIYATLFADAFHYLVPLIAPWLIKTLIDDVSYSSNIFLRKHIHIVMLSICGLYLLNTLSSYFRIYLSSLAGNCIGRDLRKDLYLHLQSMSLSFFDQQKTGELVTHLTQDISTAQHFVGSTLMNTFMEILFISVTIFILLTTNWQLACIALMIIPCFAIADYLLAHKFYAHSRQIQSEFQKISGELHEQFSAISTIQAFNQEDHASTQLEQHTQNYLTLITQHSKLQAFYVSITSGFIWIGPIIVLWFGIIQVWHNQISIGTLMAFYAYLGFLYMPIQRLTELKIVLTNSLAAIDRIFEVLDMHSDVLDKPKASVLQITKAQIAFDSITFAYPERKNIFNNFSLNIPSGKSYALVGPSGSGKSTLLKLILRFYDITSGNIRINNIDIQNVTLQSLRQNIALVSQEPILFSGTIFENIKFGKSSASQEEIVYAAHLAFADTFIEHFPEKYQTLIGERGLNLSGGEKQRIALARAFLKSAPILLLDEPTSALDPDSEVLIKKALKNLIQNKTALIIAHRLSTLEFADQIIVIENGQILEQGSHSELMQNKYGLYKKYIEQQTLILTNQ